jgi:hypothetical protein
MKLFNTFSLIATVLKIFERVVYIVCLGVGYPESTQ